MNTSKKEIVSAYKKSLETINKKLERLSKPACVIDAFNSIVLNKERMLSLTTNEENIITYEFDSLFPTYFTPERARQLQNEVGITDCDGNEIKLEIVGAKEFYELLKACFEERLNIAQKYLQ